MLQVSYSLDMSSVSCFQKSKSSYLVTICELYTSCYDEPNEDFS